MFLQTPVEEAGQGEELAIIQDSQQQVIFHFCHCQLKANINKVKKEGLYEPNRVNPIAQCVWNIF